MAMQNELNIDGKSRRSAGGKTRWREMGEKEGTRGTQNVTRRCRIELFKRLEIPVLKDSGMELCRHAFTNVQPSKFVNANTDDGVWMTKPVAECLQTGHKCVLDLLPLPSKRSWWMRKRVIGIIEVHCASFELDNTLQRSLIPVRSLPLVQMSRILIPEQRLQRTHPIEGRSRSTECEIASGNEGLSIFFPATPFSPRPATDFRVRRLNLTPESSNFRGLSERTANFTRVFLFARMNVPELLSCL